MEMLLRQAALSKIDPIGVVMAWSVTEGHLNGKRAAR